MGVNRFMGPVQTQRIQTYVDQYVPMPFETMLAVAQKKEQDVNKMGQNVATIKNWLQVEAIPDEYGGNQETYRNEIVSGYENQIRNAITESKGDLNALRGSIGKLSQDIFQDVTRGSLATIGNNTSLWKKEVYETRPDLVAKGKDKGGYTQTRANQLGEIERRNFIAADTYRETGDIQRWQSAGNTLEYDYNKRFGEYGTTAKANQIAEFLGADFRQTEDGKFYFFDKETNKGVSRKRLEPVINNLIDSDTDLQAEFAHNIAYDPENGAALNAEIERGLKENFLNMYSYNQQSLDRTVRTPPSGSGSTRDPLGKYVVGSDTIIPVTYDKTSPLSNYNPLFEGLLKNTFKPDGSTYSNQDVAAISYNLVKNGLVPGVAGSKNPYQEVYTKTGQSLSSMSELDRLKAFTDGSVDLKQIPLFKGATEEQMLNFVESAEDIRTREVIFKNREQELKNKAVSSLTNTEREYFNNFEKLAEPLVKKLGMSVQEYISFMPQKRDDNTLSLLGVPRYEILRKKNPEAYDALKVLYDKQQSTLDKVNDYIETQKEELTGEVFQEKTYTNPNIPASSFYSPKTGQTKEAALNEAQIEADRVNNEIQNVLVKTINNHGQDNVTGQLSSKGGIEGVKTIGQFRKTVDPKTGKETYVDLAVKHTEVGSGGRKIILTKPGGEELIINESDITIGRSGTGKNILTQYTDDEEVAKYIKTRAGNQESYVNLDQDFSFLPKGLMLYIPNNQDREDFNPLTDSGIELQWGEADKTRKIAGLNFDENKQLVSLAIKGKAKLKKATTLNERNKILAELRSKFQSTLEYYKNN